MTHICLSTVSVRTSRLVTPGSRGGWSKFQCLPSPEFTQMIPVDECHCAVHEFSLRRADLFPYNASVRSSHCVVVSVDEKGRPGQKQKTRIFLLLFADRHLIGDKCVLQKVERAFIMFQF